MAQQQEKGFHERHRSQYLVDTDTTESQEDTENECKPYFIDLEGLRENEYEHLRSKGLMHPETRDICLLRNVHYDYLSRAFQQQSQKRLPSSFVVLDASRPWMMYWTLHSCDLLNRLPPEENLVGIVHTLEACWQSVPLEFTDAQVRDDPYLSGITHMEGGGFAGGPGQMAHCATTYAAVLCLSIIATQPDIAAATTGDNNDDDDENVKDMSLDVPEDEEPSSRTLARKLLREKRLPLYAWFCKLQQPNGGYRMHFDGEIDVRATYIVLCCASLLQTYSSSSSTSSFLGSSRVLGYVQKCQTMEGGFGGEPWAEAHGGYTFCAVAALELMKSLPSVDLAALRGWLVRRQMAYEGGFQGRSNKLVDGCYSFWQGGALAIVSMQHKNNNPNSQNHNVLLFQESLLQRYILLCAQDMNGGLRDKPSTPRDFYHSCYNLSGLSVSQHCGSLQYGHPTESSVAATHPVYNIRRERAAQMLNQDTSFVLQ